MKVTTFLNLFGASDSDTGAYKSTDESFPAFTSAISALYVGIGDEPVGRPSTNGFSGVGPKFLMLTTTGAFSAQRLLHILGLAKYHPPLGNVVGDVIAHGFGVVTDDETCAR